MSLRRFRLKFKNECRAGVNRFIKAPIRRHLIEKSVRHIHGPTKAHCNRNEFVALSFMRNAELHVEDFVEHHLGLGAKQIFILDNGSTDSSVELARKYSGVTLFQCLLPYKYFKYEFRRFLYRHFANECWGLSVDIDERFYHLFPDSMNMSGFLEYLNRHNYNAVMGHMLDLFPAGPIKTWPGNGKDLVRKSCWYDLQCLTRHKPRIKQRLKLTGQRLFTIAGGVRASGFKMGNPPNLSKYPLLFSDGKVYPSESSSHQIRGGIIADITCLLKHYKFHRDFKTQCQDIVKEKSYFKDSLEYREYLKTLETDDGLTLKTENARRLHHVNQLIDENFLVASETFTRYVKENSLPEINIAVEKLSTNQSLARYHSNVA